MKQAGTISSADLGGSSDYTSDDPCRLKWRKVSREVRYDASESLLSTSQTGLKTVGLVYHCYLHVAKGNLVKIPELEGGCYAVTHSDKVTSG